MLNISNNNISGKILRDQYASLHNVEQRRSGRVLIRLLGFAFALLLIAMFIPWTQNIQSRGKVTTLKPDQRPQTIHSVLPGRIEQWYVKEGDFVEKGDTILFISEIKDDYLDPKLVDRTEQQVSSKQQALKGYGDKVKALNSQIRALKQGVQLKLEQSRNKLQQKQLKVKSDSMAYEAAQVDFQIAKEQFDRMEKLYKEGLKSLTDLEKRKLTLQKAQAYMITSENKLLTSRNEVINARVELNSVRAEYEKDKSKAESDKFTAMSNLYDAEATVSKMQNQLDNYKVRSGMYYIKAPQAGYITKAIQSGLGETVKAGEKIVSIMPSKYELAVEMYVKPIDLPLLEKGQHVRVQFDGWPAIVFSGWPNTSYGTYGGEIVAIDNFISDNGKYRILVAPEERDHPWPNALRVGAGISGMILMKDVPIWYELWRNLNGFPPDYYKSDAVVEKKK